MSAGSNPSRKREGRQILEISQIKRLQNLTHQVLTGDGRIEQGYKTQTQPTPIHLSRKETGKHC